MYHGLGDDFRPLDDPEAEPRRIGNVPRYRRLLYGFGKASAVMEEGAPAEEKPRRPVREREQRTAGGVVLPTGTSPPAG